LTIYRSFNAVAESWFATLKVELVHRAHYRTRAEARAAIFAWIAWYNRFRLHSTRDYLPPIEWEHQQPSMLLGLPRVVQRHRVCQGSRAGIGVSRRPRDGGS
jgi:Integrase core domain